MTGQHTDNIIVIKTYTLQQSSPLYVKQYIRIVQSQGLRDGVLLSGVGYLLRILYWIVVG